MALPAEISSTLQAIRDRKAMYFEPVDVPTAMTFINGFLTGCFAFGIDLDWQAAEAERGWKTMACGPIPEMRQRGLADDAIVDELLAILSVATRQAATSSR